MLGSPAGAPPGARMLPFDREAEQSVLGALMLDQNAVAAVRDILLAEDFYEERHQSIFRACVELHDRGEAIDVITLRNQLERHQALARSGGIDYLSDLSNAVPTAASVRHYADIVIEHATRRRLVRVGQEIADIGLDETLRADQATDLAEQRVFAVAQQRRGDDAVHIAPLLHDTWSQLEQALGERKIVTGVATNFSDLDKKTQGLQPGELVILAARPSVGKTSFALNIARNSAVLAGEPTVIFSLEMSREALVQRLLCSEAHVDSFLLRTGQARPEDFQKIAKALDKLHRADIWIDDTPGLSIAQLRARARRMKAQYAIKLIIVDYLQLMHGGRQESRVQEVSDISAGLKGIAKELQLPVLALSQLSRESERRQDRTPQLSDLRDSGSIEQDADVVLFLFRPGMHDRERDASETKLLVAKNRNGPIGDIDLIFNAEQTSFREPYRGRVD
jgi:replicative DNA helicase